MKKKIMAFMLAVFLAPCLWAKAPNIIFILADDLGSGDLSFLGQKTLATPAIDKFAGEGMFFTQHYAGSSVCGPSRGVLMCGQHTGHAAIRGNKHTPGIGVAPLDPDIPTLPETVKNKTDYMTAMFGRWHCGGELSEQTPFHRGFDMHWGKLSSDFPNKSGVMIDALWDESGKHVPYEKYSTMNIEPMYENGELANLSVEDMKLRPINMDAYVTHRAVKYILDERDKPFFMYVAYNLVHEPMESHPDFANGSNAWPEQEEAFATMLKALDSYVARILEAIDDAGIRENTVVIFASDNGAHSEGGHHVEFFDSNGDMRSYKRAFYEGGVHTPLIVRWPGVVKPGSSSDHISAFWDIMPTICDIAGAPIPKHTDGISFMPTLKGGAQQEHEYLYWEFNEHPDIKGDVKTFYKQAVRYGDWKGIHRVHDGSFELYNLKEDPSEMHGVAAQYPEVVKTIKSFMKEAHTPNSVFPLLKSEWEGRKRD